MSTSEEVTLYRTLTEASTASTCDRAQCTFQCCLHHRSTASVRTQPCGLTSMSSLIFTSFVSSFLFYSHSYEFLSSSSHSLRAILLQYTSQWVLIYSKVIETKIHHQIPDVFHHPVPINSQSHSPPQPQPQRTLPYCLYGFVNRCLGTVL